MNTHTGPILVAPRPVRLATVASHAYGSRALSKRTYTTPADLFDRLKLSCSPEADGADDRKRSPSRTPRDTSPLR